MELKDKEQKWRFYLSPGDAWEAMYQDCLIAKQSIKMEQYILANDDIGQKFMCLFISKAKEGLRVHLLIDEVGSYTMVGSPLIKEFEQEGGTFSFYNSPRLVDVFKPKLLFPRTHLKVLVIDSEIAYVGGVCFEKRMEYWRDTQLRITDSIIKTIEKALQKNSEEIVRAKPRSPKEKTVISPVKGDFAYIQNDPTFFRHPIYYLMLDHIKRANEFIYISTAFFIPTRRLRRFLKKAAHKGIDVIVLISHHSESKIADWVCLSYAQRLMRNGVKFYGYEPSILHTKTAVMDGKWGTVGSCNMDPLSFFHNREANLIITDPNALSEMKKDFLSDLEKSHPLTYEDYKNSPWWKRAIGYMARILRPFL